MPRRMLIVVFLFLVTLIASAPWAESQEGNAVPAYNAAPPPKDAKLPPILGRDALWGADAEQPYQLHAYELASKIPATLHQQPCYCYCDRMGHNSLHSCFEDSHGAYCDVCLRELYYTYAQHKKGRTAAQIRKGIIAGDWRQVSLETAAAIN
jgi:hypothetical protein